MEPLDPDFEYPHHRIVLDQLKSRLAKWSQEDEKNFGIHLNLPEFRNIIVDLESQVTYYEANRNSIQLADLSSLIQIPLEEDTYLLFYNYKMLRQQIMNNRLSASQIMKEMIVHYERTMRIKD